MRQCTMLTKLVHSSEPSETRVHGCHLRIPRRPRGSVCAHRLCGRIALGQLCESHWGLVWRAIGLLTF